MASEQNLYAVLERRVPEGSLRPGIPQRRRLPVGRELQADLDAIEADFARERNLADVAALPEVPVGHPDADGRRIGGGVGLRRTSGLQPRHRGHRSRRDGPLPHEIPSRHQHVDLQEGSGLKAQGSGLRLRLKQSLEHPAVRLGFDALLSPEP